MHLEECQCVHETEVQAQEHTTFGSRGKSFLSVNMLAARV